MSHLEIVPSCPDLSQAPTEQSLASDAWLCYDRLCFWISHTFKILSFLSQQEGCFERTARKTEAQEGQGLAQYHVMGHSTS